MQHNFDFIVSAETLGENLSMLAMAARVEIPANVSVSIYTGNGVLVRTLSLGSQPAGRYESRSRAAYWDGKNEAGESVASGVYFYTLTTGDFRATRKLLIRK